MKKNLLTVLKASVLFLGMTFTINCSAKESEVQVKGKQYEFSDETDYDIKMYSGSTDGSRYGSFKIVGDLVEAGTKNGVPAYKVNSADDGKTGKVDIVYSYSDSLLKASENQWHLVKDSSDKVADFTLPDDIGKGALILQTSFDGGEHWVTVKSETNAFEEMPVCEDSFYSTKSIQLVNGCNFRFIVVYKTEMSKPGKSYLFINTTDDSALRHAEVYEFYLVNKEVNTAAVKDPGKERLLMIDAKVVETEEKGSGYSEKNTIDIVNGDPHFGWEIGNFYVTGFTEDKTDKDNNPVFLKTVGDRVTLWFKLEQDINQLNGNPDLVIAENEKANDVQFGYGPSNFKRGMLFVRYKDRTGKYVDEVEYEDYLAACGTKGAYTSIDLFEEGDYEIALDYEIEDKSPTFINDHYDYRIHFRFSIRNGNCMAYPFDTKTKAELADNSFTENGFELNLAGSEYLTIEITREVLSPGSNSLTMDIRENKVAKEGEKFKKEGIYTFTIGNDYIKTPTKKTIYVGTDPVMKAYVVYGKIRTIQEIRELVDNGATIEEDGTIKLLTPTKMEEEQQTATESESSTVSVAGESQNELLEDAREPKQTEANEQETAESLSDVSDNADQNDGMTRLLGILAMVACLGAGIAIGHFCRKKSKSDAASNNDSGTGYGEEKR